MTDYSLTHLKQLEAESIHIIREVAAEFDNPVMLYSIGKDSSVMLHLAMKAFYPGKPPFPLMHVDTTWKFREMIQFRDEQARKLGLDLIVHIGRRWTNISLMPLSAAAVATRKNPGPRSAFSPSATATIAGTRRTSVRNYGTSTTAA